MNTEKYNNEKTRVYLLGGIFSEPENDGFHKQNLDKDFRSYRTINRAKVNISMPDINV